MKPFNSSRLVGTGGEPGSGTTRTLPGLGSPAQRSSQKDPSQVPPLVSTPSLNQANDEIRSAMEKLSEGILKNIRFVRLSLYSIECVGRMLVDHAAVDALVDTGCLKTLIKVLESHPENSELRHLLNCTLLKAASIGPDAARKVAEALGDDAKLLFGYEFKSNSASDTLADASANALFAALMIASAPATGAEATPPSSTSRIAVTANEFARGSARTGTWEALVRRLEAKLETVNAAFHSTADKAAEGVGIQLDPAFYSVLGAFHAGISDLTLAEVVVQDQHERNARTKQEHAPGLLDQVVHFASVVAQREDQRFASLSPAAVAEVSTTAANSASAYRIVQRMRGDGKFQEGMFTFTNPLLNDSQVLESSTSSVYATVLASVSNTAARLLAQSGFKQESFLATTLPLCDYLAKVINPTSAQTIADILAHKSLPPIVNEPRLLLQTATTGAQLFSLLVQEAERVHSPSQVQRVIDTIRLMCTPNDLNALVLYSLDPVNAPPPPSHLVPFSCVTVSVLSGKEEFSRAECIALLRQFAALTLVDKLQSAFIQANGFEAVYQLARKMSSFNAFQSELARTAVANYVSPAVKVAYATPLISAEYASILLTSAQVYGFTAAALAILRCSGMLHGSTVNRSHPAFLLVDHSQGNEIIDLHASLLHGDLRSLSQGVRQNRTSLMIESASMTTMRALSLLLYDVIILVDALYAGCSRVERKVRAYAQSVSSHEQQTTSVTLNDVALAMRDVLPLLGLLSERIESATASVLAAQSLCTSIPHIIKLYETDVLLYLQQMAEFVAAAQAEALHALNVVNTVCPPDFVYSILFGLNSDSSFTSDEGAPANKPSCAGVDVDAFFIACTAFARGAAQFVSTCSAFIYPGSICSQAINIGVNPATSAPDEAARRDTEAISEFGGNILPILDALAPIAIRATEMDILDVHLESVGVLCSKGGNKADRVSELTPLDEKQPLQSPAFTPVSRVVCALRRMNASALTNAGIYTAADDLTTTHIVSTVLSFSLPLIARILTSSPGTLKSLGAAKQRLREKAGTALQLPRELQQTLEELLVRSAASRCVDTLPGMSSAEEYIQSQYATQLMQEAHARVNQPATALIAALTTFLECAAVLPVRYLPDDISLATRTLQALLVARQDASINTFLGPSSSIGVDPTTRLQHLEQMLANIPSDGASASLEPISQPTLGQVARLKAVFEAFAKEVAERAYRADPKNRAALEAELSSERRLRANTSGSEVPTIDAVLQQLRSVSQDALATVNSLFAHVETALAQLRLVPINSSEFIPGVRAQDIQQPEWVAPVSSGGESGAGLANALRRATMTKSALRQQQLQASEISQDGLAQDISALMPFLPAIRATSLHMAQQTPQQSSQSASQGMTAGVPKPKMLVGQVASAHIVQEPADDDEVRIEGAPPPQNKAGVAVPLQLEDAALEGTALLAARFANSLPNLTFPPPSSQHSFKSASSQHNPANSANSLVGLLTTLNDLVGELCQEVVQIDARQSTTYLTFDKLRHGFTRLIGLFDTFTSRKPSLDRAKGLAAVCAAIESVVDAATRSSSKYAVGAPLEGEVSALSILKGEMHNALFTFDMLRRLACAVQAESTALSQIPDPSLFASPSEFKEPVAKFASRTFLMLVFPALQDMASPPPLSSASRSSTLDEGRAESERDASLARFVARLLVTVPLPELFPPNCPPVVFFPRKLGRNPVSAQTVTPAQWQHFVMFVKETDRRIAFASTSASAPKRSKAVEPPPMPQGLQFEFAGILAAAGFLNNGEEKKSEGEKSDAAVQYEAELLAAYGAKSFDQLPSDEAREQFKKETQRREIHIAYLLQKLWNITDVSMDGLDLAKALLDRVVAYKTQMQAEADKAAAERAAHMQASVDAARAVEKLTLEAQQVQFAEEQRAQLEAAARKAAELKAAREAEMRKAQEDMEAELARIREVFRQQSVQVVQKQRAFVERLDGTNAIGKVEDYLPPDTLEFLTTGGLVTKHGRKGRASRRLLYLSLANPQSIVWREPHLSQPKSSQVMKLGRFVNVEPGLACPDLRLPGINGYGTDFDKIADDAPETATTVSPLQEIRRIPPSGSSPAPLLRLPTKVRVNAMPLPSAPTQTPEKGAACFAIFGTDLEGEYRELGFEAPNPATARLWVYHLRILLEYCKLAQRPFEERTGVHQANILYEEGGDTQKRTIPPPFLRQGSRRKVQDDADEIKFVRVPTYKQLPGTGTSVQSQGTSQAESANLSEPAVSTNMTESKSTFIPNTAASANPESAQDTKDEDQEDGAIPPPPPLMTHEPLYPAHEHIPPPPVDVSEEDHQEVEPEVPPPPPPPMDQTSIPHDPPIDYHTFTTVRDPEVPPHSPAALRPLLPQAQAQVQHPPQPLPQPQPQSTPGSPPMEVNQTISPASTTRSLPSLPPRPPVLPASTSTPTLPSSPPTLPTQVPPSRSVSVQELPQQAQPSLASHTQQQSPAVSCSIAAAAQATPSQPAPSLPAKPAAASGVKAAKFVLRKPLPGSAPAPHAAPGAPGSASVPPPAGVSSPVGAAFSAAAPAQPLVAELPPAPSVSPIMPPAPAVRTPSAASLSSLREKFFAASLGQTSSVSLVSSSSAQDDDDLPPPPPPAFGDGQ